MKETNQLLVDRIRRRGGSGGGRGSGKGRREEGGECRRSRKERGRGGVFAAFASHIGGIVRGGDGRRERLRALFPRSRYLKCGIPFPGLIERSLDM